jgi:hypothetical protein
MPPSQRELHEHRVRGLVDLQPVEQVRELGRPSRSAPSIMQNSVAWENGSNPQRSSLRRA